MKDFRNIIVLIVLMIVFNNLGFSQIKDTLYQKIRDNEKLNLKNYSFCKCLQYSLPKDSAIQNDGTDGENRYWTIYNLKVFDKLDSIAKIFALKNYTNIDKYKRNIMKCLDFYNSKDLDLFINNLENYIDFKLLKFKIDYGY